MIKYEFANLFEQDSIEKQVRIYCNDGVLTNEDIYSEEMEIAESLCEDTFLNFGACVSNSIKFTTSNKSFKLDGNSIVARMFLNGEKEKYFELGTYKVFSAKYTADRSKREVVAYDILHDVLLSNYAEWYNGLQFPLTLKEFRDSFFLHLGIVQEKVTLVNDNMIIEKTVNASELNGASILQGLCQLNGVFGHITRKNTFSYISLTTYSDYIYPSNNLFPRNDLYPRGSTVDKRFTEYRECTYEDYEVKGIDKVVIRQDENDIGGIYGNGQNAFIVQGNIFAYGKSADELSAIAKNLYSVVENKPYIPSTVKVTGNPCMEVGDVIKVHTADNAIVSTYIMRRVLKGVQALVDEYNSQGDELQAEQIATVNNSVVQLKGNIATVKLTVDGISSRVESIEDGSASVIQQLSNEISLKVSTEDYESAISQLSNSISAKVSSNGGNNSFSWHLESDKFELKSNGNVVFRCNSSGISVAGMATASDIYALSGRIGSLESDHVTTQQLNAVDGKIDTLSAKSITTDNFTSQKITAGMVNSGVISASKITTGTLSVDRLNVGDIVGKLTTQTITCVKVDCTSNITAPTGNIASCGITTLNGVNIGSLYVQNGYLRV